MFRTALLTAATVAALPTLSLAADRWESQVRLQMLAAVAVSLTQGYTLRDDVQVGSLRQGQSTSFTFTASEGQQYMVVANCDADCRDVDLVVSEPDGREFADRDATDLALVKLGSGHTGTHRITVSMPHCQANPCRFGLALLTK